MHRLHGIPGIAALVLVSACGPGPADTDPTTDATAATTSTATSSATVTDTGTTASPTTGPVTTGPDTTSSPATSESETSDTTTTEATTGGGDGLPACAFAELAVTGLAGQAFVAGDFDGDGAIDLAVKPDGGTVQLHLNDGSGTGFTATGVVHDIAGGGEMAAGDFDGDGRLDLLHYDFSIAEQIQLQLNVGGELDAPLSIPLNALFYTARVADVDGDGDSDFSHGGHHSEPVHVMLADGGTLIDTHLLQPSACYATGSDWADFDGDGDLDFAVIGDCNQAFGTPPIAVHLREGDTYVALPDVGQAESSDPPVLAAGDFDGDGVVDIVTQGHHQSPHVDHHRGLGDAAFAAREPFDVPVDRWVREALDVDGDGLADLLAAGDGSVVLYRGPSFEPCLVGAGELVAAGDFDGDGRLDVLVKDGTSFTLAHGQ